MSHQIVVQPLNAGIHLKADYYVVIESHQFHTLSTQPEWFMSGGHDANFVNHAVATRDYVERPFHSDISRYFCSRLTSISLDIEKRVRQLRRSWRNDGVAGVAELVIL